MGEASYLNACPEMEFLSLPHDRKMLTKHVVGFFIPEFIMSHFSSPSKEVVFSVRFVCLSICL